MLILVGLPHPCHCSIHLLLLCGESRGGLLCRYGDRVSGQTFHCLHKAEDKRPAIEAYSPNLTLNLQVTLSKVVHTCGGGSKVVNKFSFIKYSALCSNGTIYSQEMGVSCCRHWADCISFVVILIADLPLVVPGWLWKLWKVLFQPGLFNPHQNTKCLFHSHRNTQCSVCIHPEQHPGWLPIFGSIFFLF